MDGTSGFFPANTVTWLQEVVVYRLSPVILGFYLEIIPKRGKLGICVEEVPSNNNNISKINTWGCCATAAILENVVFYVL